MEEEMIAEEKATEESITPEIAVQEAFSCQDSEETAVVVRENSSEQSCNPVKDDAASTMLAHICCKGNGIMLLIATVIYTIISVGAVVATPFAIGLGAVLVIFFTPGSILSVLFIIWAILRMFSSVGLWMISIGTISHKLRNWQCSVVRVIVWIHGVVMCLLMVCCAWAWFSAVSVAIFGVALIAIALFYWFLQRYLRDLGAGNYKPANIYLLIGVFFITLCWIGGGAALFLSASASSDWTILGIILIVSGISYALFSACLCRYNWIVKHK